MVLERKEKKYFRCMTDTCIEKTKLYLQEYLVRRVRKGNDSSFYTLCA